MNPNKKASRTKRKLVKLTGTSQPREDLRRLVAFHSLENPDQILRIASKRKLALETRALQEKFPEIGKRIAKKPAAERLAILRKLDSLGRQKVESGLKKGFALQELLNYPNRKELDAFLRRTTPKRVKQLKALGLNETMARNLCILIERHGLKKTTAFVEKLKRLGLSPNTVKLATYTEFYHTGKSDFLSTHNREKPVILAETPNAIIIQAPGTRMRFVDFKRYGKELFAKKFNFSREKQTALTIKSILPFNFAGKVKRIVSSNPLVSFHYRHAFYMEVPKIGDLIREAKPKRQHLQNALAYADILSLPPKENLTGRIHVFELQSDIVAKLEPEKRERYKSWPELAILGLADYASKKGFGEITMSSPHLVKQVWPHLGKRLTQQIYYDLPKKMGFQLFQSKAKLQYIDVAFGTQLEGKSGVFWFIRTEDLKKRFPEFFR